jgi:hypothetical protein
MITSLVISSAMMLIPAVYAARIRTPIAVAHASVIALSAVISMCYWATEDEHSAVSHRLLELDHAAATFRMLVDLAVLIATWPRNIPRSLMATGLGVMAVTLYNIRSTIDAREGWAETMGARSQVAHFGFHVVGIAAELVLMRAAYGADVP